MKTVVWAKDTAWEATVRQAEQEEVSVMRDGHVVAPGCLLTTTILSGNPRRTRSRFPRVARQGTPAGSRRPDDHARRPEEKFALDSR